MKCIRNLETNEVKRVDNETAYKAVDSGKYKFVPKLIWKQEVRDKNKKK